MAAGRLATIRSARFSPTATSARPSAQILGQAYVTAYALMYDNRDAIERIADTLVERKEMYGDDVVDLLNSVGLQRPELDLMDDATWPKV